MPFYEAVEFQLSQLQDPISDSVDYNEVGIPNSKKNLTLTSDASAGLPAKAVDIVALAFSADAPEPIASVTYMYIVEVYWSEAKN